MNRALQIILVTILWLFLSRGVINNTGLLGSLIHNISNRILPNDIAGISGAIVIWVILTLLYISLSYIILVKLTGTKRK